MPDDLLDKLPGENGNVLGALVMALVWVLWSIVKRLLNLIPGRTEGEELEGQQAKLHELLRKDVAYVAQHGERLEKRLSALERKIDLLLEHPDYRRITLGRNETDV